MNKGTLLLDVDGPLFNTTAALIRAVNGRVPHKRGGDDPDWKVPASENDVTDFNWKKFFGLRAWDEAEDIMGDRHFWRDLSTAIVPGAAAAVRAFREVGLHVVFVSSPWVSCREWEDARRKALMDAFGPCKSSTDSKHTINLIPAPHDLKHLVDGLAFVDDRPGASFAWQQHAPHRRGFLWDAPWNQHDDKHPVHDTLHRALIGSRLLGGWTLNNVWQIAYAAFDGEHRSEFLADHTRQLFKEYSTP